MGYRGGNRQPSTGQEDGDHFQKDIFEKKGLPEPPPNNSSITLAAAEW